MPHPERRLRPEFDRQMRTALVGGVPAGTVVGCVYALLDTDKEALYVGTSTGTSERLKDRLSRHVPNGRSDAANKVFPPYEVRYVRVWLVMPQPVMRDVTRQERATVRGLERHLLWRMLQGPVPPFPPLNEDVPRQAPPVVRVPPSVDIDYWPSTDVDAIAQLGDIDARVNRWAESVSRLAERVKHGDANDVLRDVQKRQIARLASLVV